MSENLLNLPKDESTEAKKVRKEFIIAFYSQWIALTCIIHSISKNNLFCMS